MQCFKDRDDFLQLFNQVFIVQPTISVGASFKNLIGMQIIGAYDSVALTHERRHHQQRSIRFRQHTFLFIVSDHTSSIICIESTVMVKDPHYFSLARKRLVEEQLFPFRIQTFAARTKQIW